MPQLEFSERFANDLAKVTSDRVERHIYRVLDNIEAFGGFGSPVVPDSIRAEFGEEVRKVFVAPFDLVYTYYPDKNVARIETLIYARAVT